MTLNKQVALLIAVMVATFGVLASAQDAKKPAAKKARVFFVEPKNNATVSSPVHMKFGSEGIEIAAGQRGTSRPRDQPSPTITAISIRAAYRPERPS